MSLYHCREIPNDVAIKAGIPSNNVDIIKVIWPNKWSQFTGIKGCHWHFLTISSQMSLFSVSLWIFCCRVLLFWDGNEVFCCCHWFIRVVFRLLVFLCVFASSLATIDTLVIWLLKKKSILGHSCPSILILHQTRKFGT